LRASSRRFSASNSSSAAFAFDGAAGAGTEPEAGGGGEDLDVSGIGVADPSVGGIAGNLAATLSVVSPTGSVREGATRSECLRSRAGA
jgi:hypothetical protein